MAVSGAQRFIKARPCPICGGYDEAPRGQGIRCFGFLSDDNLYAHCTREEHAGTLEQHPDSGTYAHRLAGDCRCGVQHGPPLSGGNSTSPIVATCDYTDENGALLFYPTPTTPAAGTPSRWRIAFCGRPLRFEFLNCQAQRTLPSGLKRAAPLRLTALSTKISVLVTSVLDADIVAGES